MIKRFAILACALMLGGCALPVPLQVASWALDGLLFITTEKTMADHGVSIAVQRDCAMLRVVTEGAFCRDYIGETTVAVLELPPPENDGTASAVSVADALVIDTADLAATMELAAFETAAGTSAEVLSDVPIEEPLGVEARWQAIIDSPAFLDEWAEVTVLEPKRQGPSEMAADWAIPGSAPESSPPEFDEFEALSEDEDRLILGDIYFDLHPYVMADLTLLGGAMRDGLAGATGDFVGRWRDYQGLPPVIHGLALVARSRSAAKRQGRGPPRRRRRLPTIRTPGRRLG